MNSATKQKLARKANNRLAVEALNFHQRPEQIAKRMAEIDALLAARDAQRKAQDLARGIK